MADRTPPMTSEHIRLAERDTGEADWDLPYEDLDLPVLVMTGEHDRLFRIDADVAQLTARLPQATTVRFSDAGHLIPAEQPEAFTRELLAFAEGL